MRIALQLRYWPSRSAALELGKTKVDSLVPSCLFGSRRKELIELASLRLNAPLLYICPVGAVGMLRALAIASFFLHRLKETTSGCVAASPIASLLASGFDPPV
jgi:hypothetical protein